MKLQTYTAVPAVCLLATVAHGASTGWDLSNSSVTDENGNRIKVLYVGPTTNASDASNCVRTGIDSVKEDSQNNTVINTVTVADYDSDLTNFRISADKENNQVATINSLKANDNSTITVANSGWTPIKKFSNLTIGNLSVNNGSIIVSDGEKLTLNGLTGSLSNVTVYGNLTLSSTVQGLNNFTLGANASLGGTYNLGQQFSGGVTFTLLDVADDVAACIAGGNNYERQLTSTMWNAERITSAILNVGDYDNGGLVFYNMDNKKYYSTTTWSGGTASFSDENIITLSNDTAYIVAKIQKNKNNYHSITGLYGTVTIPEPTTATLSLLALAGLAARRRR